MSKVRLGALALLVIAVVVVLIVRDKQEPAGTEPKPTVTAMATPIPSVTVDDSPTLELASRAVTALQIRNVDERNAQLQPITTPTYYKLISYADPANIEINPPNGKSRSVLDADGTAVVDVPLTEGMATVTLQDVNLDGNWLVDDILTGDA